MKAWLKLQIKRLAEFVVPKRGFTARGSLLLRHFGTLPCRLWFKTCLRRLLPSLHMCYKPEHA